MRIVKTSDEFCFIVTENKPENDSKQTIFIEEHTYNEVKRILSTTFNNVKADNNYWEKNVHDKIVKALEILLPHQDEVDISNSVSAILEYKEDE